MRARAKKPSGCEASADPASVLNRRQFLAAGAGLALASGLTSTAFALPVPNRRHLVTVFRLSTHGQRVCHACKANGANKFFRTRAAADSGRAHPGCNCAIVTQRIPLGVAQRYFRHRLVFDLRSTA